MAKKWTIAGAVKRAEAQQPAFDLSQIPDAAFWAEVQRRRAALRKVKSGGSVWGHHNPKTKRCMCAACNEKRSEVKS